MRRSTLALVAVVALTTCALGAGAQAPGASESARTQLDEARTALGERRYQRALAILGPVLADPALDSALHTDALVLRAWVNAARGDLSAAAADWGTILAIRPDFEPDPDTLSPKARARFQALRAAVVGRARIVVDPPDAEVRINGGLAHRAADGSVALPLGPHVVSASLDGFDTAEQAVEVEAGRTTDIRLELVPNAGVIVIRTIPDGVTVLLDDAPVGVTTIPAATPDASGADGVAELRLDRVQLGEHRVELSKPCHRATTLRVSVAANLLERSARTVGPVVLEPASATVTLRGGPADADVFMDGEPRGKLSAARFSRCPGRIGIEVRAGARLLWGESVELGPDDERTLDVGPRPNVLLYGAEGWPAQFAKLAATLGWRSAGALPVGTDLSTADGWRAVPLAEDVDLIAALVPGSGGAAGERWLLVSPVLGTVEPLEATLALDRPRWRGGELGLEVADSRIGGPLRVVRVTREGPAARAGIVVGERIVQVGGAPVDSARGLRRALDGAPTGAPLAVRVESRSGEMRSLELDPLAAARPIAIADTPGAAALVAAWARVDAVALPQEDAVAALANLATLLARAGRHREAAAAWGEVLRSGAASVCRGSAAYHRGVALQASGNSQEARDALRIAAESNCAAFDAPEALVAPAARALLEVPSAPGATSR